MASEWSPERARELESELMYGDLKELLLRTLHTPNARHVADYMETMSNHVPVLYVDVRNRLKFVHPEMVITNAALSEGLVRALVLLVRVLQDTASYQCSFGSEKNSHLPRRFHSKLVSWIRGHYSSPPSEGSPETGWLHPKLAFPVIAHEACTRVTAAMATGGVDLPTPVWVEVVGESQIYRNTIYFGNVPARLLHASRNNNKIATSRSNATAQALKTLRSMRSWRDFCDASFLHDGHKTFMHVEVPCAGAGGAGAGAGEQSTC